MASKVRRYVKFRDLPLQNYIDRLKRDKYFAFLRYGDGEWNAILRKGGKAGRAQQNTEEFHRDSKLTFLEYCGIPGIYFGMQNNVLRIEKMRTAILRFLRENNTEIRWVNADVFHYASRDGKLAPLIRVMREKKVVVIGPDFLKGLQRVFQYRKFIKVAPKNCYSQKEAIINAVLVTQQELGQSVLYSFSVGPSAEVFIPSLFKKAPQNFFIDFGSMWDICCGRRTRKYMLSGNYSNMTLRRNLGLK